MKVAVFFTWDYSLNTWHDSGTISRELRFFKSLEKKKNVSFTFFTYGDSSEYELATEHNLKEVYPIYKSLTYYKNKLFRIFSSFYIPLKLKNYIKNADMLYQNQLLGSWVPILIKKIYKKPLIIRTGYDMHDFAKQDKKSSFIIFLYKVLTNFAVKNCDYFTVTSKADLNRFKKRYPKYEQKFLLRPNWVEVDELNDFKNRYSNKLLAVGRLVSQKNFDYLISEFADSKYNIEIDIVGNGPEKDNLVTQAKKYNVTINFLGNLSNRKLLKLYQRYKFFISTSLFEGNPKALLEAMGSGCVVIGSNIKNHSDIISDNQNGYLFDFGNNNLINKFITLTQADTNLSQISKDAYLFIKNEYSLDKSINSFYDDFEYTLSK